METVCAQIVCVDVHIELLDWLEYSENRNVYRTLYIPAGLKNRLLSVNVH